jgi:NitT/TauT family transport system permease protein
VSTTVDDGVTGVTSSGEVVDPPMAEPSNASRGAVCRRPSAGVWFWRAVIALVFLAAWEYLPKISWLRERYKVFNPFFISSPSKVSSRVWPLVTGTGGFPLVWSYVWATLQATFLGLAIGTVLGAVLGLALSNAMGLQRIIRPFIALMNATPRIALIPIFVLIGGYSLTSTVLTSVVVVFFLVFYNAYAGGVSVPSETVSNARLLGATSMDVMRIIRWPYVMALTFTSLPNAISFSLMAVVTTEILTGTNGVGRLLVSAINSLDATLTYSVVVILSVIGVTAVTGAEMLERKLLHWRPGSGGESH